MYFAISNEHWLFSVIPNVLKGDQKKSMTFCNLFPIIILNSLGFKPQAIEF